MSLVVFRDRSLRRFLGGVRFILLTFVLTATSNARQVERPNVLLVLVDDLGKEWIGCYGAEKIQTPRIDELAATGLMFDNFYSTPQCTPTRVTLLTGQYPFRHGWVNHWDVPRWGGGCSFDTDRNPSLGRLMKQTGYVTAAAGKWQINDFRQEPLAMEQAGFDESCMWTGYEAANPPSAERYWHPYLHVNGHSRTCAGEFGPDVFVDFLIKFMERHQDEPMFLFYPMVLCHTPLVGTPTSPTASGELTKHRAMVRYVDRLTGQLVDALNRLGLRRKTVIVWTTDNGSARAIRGRRGGIEVSGGKGLTTESGVCVPLIVNWPGAISPGRRTDVLVDLTDLLPTFAELGGRIDLVAENCDGRSFLSTMFNEKSSSERRWIMAMGGRNEAQLSEHGVENRYWFRDRVVRNRRFKLYYGPDREVQRFVDLTKDPEEATDLQESRDPATVRALRELKQVADSFPDHDNDPRYEPLPYQPWFREPTVSSQVWKTGYPQN